MNPARSLLIVGVLSAACLAFACASSDSSQHSAGAQVTASGLSQISDYQPSAYAFEIPSWMPRPLEPAGNPTTPAKVELGRRLFYDKRLSLNEQISCASCHEQAKAFTDGRRKSPGVTDALTVRNAMTLANAAYSPSLTWANPLLHSMEQQALVPLLGEAPIEMGMAGQDEELAKRLMSEPVYPKLFRKAFPEVGGEISFATVTRALAAFERTLISARSPYDRYRYEGDFEAVSDAVIRGEALFFSEKLECHHCHNGVNFNDSIFHERDPNGQRAFHNTGLYNIDGKGAYPAADTGVKDITGRAEDMGRFKTPTLRNVAVTAPYMHDGSVPTLDAAIDHYAAGGRTIAGGPNAGVGSANPLKSSFIPGFKLTEDERADLLAFLHSLTDEEFLTNPAFSDPWTEENPKQ